MALIHVGECRKIQMLVERCVFESTLWPIDTCEASCCKVTQGDVVTLLAAGEKKCTFHAKTRKDYFPVLFNPFLTRICRNYTVLGFFSVQSTFGYGKGASIKHTLLTWNAGLQPWERCYGSRLSQLPDAAPSRHVELRVGFCKSWSWF